MLFFEGLQSEAEIKKRYKDLAKQYHPDRGGCAETMKVVNAQYEKVISGAYQKAGKSFSEIEELLKKDRQAMSALHAISGVDGIEIELCGSWIWVTGNTKAFKDLLKQSKFMWAHKKRLGIGERRRKASSAGERADTHYQRSVTNTVANQSKAKTKWLSHRGPSKKGKKYEIFSFYKLYLP